MLTTTKEMFKKAQSNNCAIPSPDYFDLNSCRAYVKEAEKRNQPIILAYAEAHKEVLSLEEAALIGKYYGAKSKCDVALHLDHGMNFDVICKAIDLGFTSVMIDASMLSFDENVAKTKKVVEYAHAHGVVVEAEIGHVGSGVNYENHDHTDSIYTEVEAAKKFVELTKVDSLAVSIGTAHGKYKGTPVINFDRLHELKKAINVPLVLHGGSSSGDENLHKCATEGISKINIFTDLIVGALDSVNKNKPEDYFKLLDSAEYGMEEVLGHYYDVFDCNK